MSSASCRRSEQIGRSGVVKDLVIDQEAALVWPKNPRWWSDEEPAGQGDLISCSWQRAQSHRRNQNRLRQEKHKVRWSTATGWQALSDSHSEAGPASEDGSHVPIESIVTKGEGELVKFCNQAESAAQTIVAKLMRPAANVQKSIFPLFHALHDQAGYLRVAPAERLFEEL